MNLVYRGLPISGSWGGDCMELAKQYAGQASDADGYTSLMTGCFDSADSMFGGDDLRADMDAIVIGAQLTADSSISDTIGSYYSAINDHDRAYQFIALSFGNVDTSNTQAFRQEVYETLTQDTGMQLLLYLNGMMDSESWTVSQDYQAPLQAACNVLADYLAQAGGRREGAKRQRHPDEDDGRPGTVRRTERHGGPAGRRRGCSAPTRTLPPPVPAPPPAMCRRCSAEPPPASRPASTCRCSRPSCW